MRAVSYNNAGIFSHRAWGCWRPRTDFRNNPGTWGPALAACLYVCLQAMPLGSGRARSVEFQDGPSPI